MTYCVILILFRHRCVPDDLNELLAKVKVSKMPCRCTAFTTNGEGQLLTLHYIINTN